MATYIILTKLTPQGNKNVAADPARVQGIAEAVAGLDGKVVSQHLLLGEQDFCTIVSLPDNAAAHMLAGGSPDGAKRTILPAIDLPLFVRLLGQSTETTGPHRWQVSWWAGVLRPMVWWYEVGRQTKKYMQPFTVLGREHLRGLKGPVIVIGNHTSHMDSTAMYYALPFHLRRNLYFGGAADRWFLKGRKGIRKQGWFASMQGSFPITRGGGSATLDYPKWLIDKGGSIAIFPEGTRSRSGKMGRFKAGPAILAVSKGVPVIPMYFEGLRDIRPVGSREMKPGPVTALIGEPIRFAPDTNIGEATRTLYRAVDGLRQQMQRPQRAAPVQVPAAAGYG
jgi:1-acyl-sn-glycerol-3-phosphate acyltransferase